MKLNLHIEQLVLDGLPLSRHEAEIVQRTLRAELALRLARAEAFSTSAHVAELRAADIRLRAAGTPGHLGQDVAHAVTESLLK
jgi:hypothetical protein